MFNLGFSEITLIGVLALLLFGPDRLPEFARTVARFFKEFKRISAELQNTVHETVATIDSDMPRAPSLKEVYERIDAKRAIEEIGIRPFAAAAPGTVAAPPAVDASETPAETGLAMGKPARTESDPAEAAAAAGETETPVETSSSIPVENTRSTAIASSVAPATDVPTAPLSPHLEQAELPNHPA